VQNGTLREYLDSSKSLKATEQIDVVHQMIFGLAYLHNHKISHGDFKSLNVLLDAGHGYSSSDCTHNSFIFRIALCHLLAAVHLYILLFDTMLRRTGKNICKISDFGLSKSEALSATMGATTVMSSEYTPAWSAPGTNSSHYCLQKLFSPSCSITASPCTLTKVFASYFLYS
jgi:serine/threonine protein kinase